MDVLTVCLVVGCGVETDNVITLAALPDGDDITGPVCDAHAELWQGDPIDEDTP